MIYRLLVFTALFAVYTHIHTTHTIHTHIECLIISGNRSHDDVEQVEECVVNLLNLKISYHIQSC